MMTLDELEDAKQAALAVKKGCLRIAEAILRARTRNTALGHQKPAPVATLDWGYLQGNRVHFRAYLGKDGPETLNAPVVLLALPDHTVESFAERVVAVGLVLDQLNAREANRKALEAAYAPFPLATRVLLQEAFYQETERLRAERDAYVELTEQERASATEEKTT